MIYHFESAADFVNRTAASVAEINREAIKTPKTPLDKWRWHAVECAEEKNPRYYGKSGKLLAAVHELENAPAPKSIAAAAAAFREKIEADAFTGTERRRVWEEADEGEINIARIIDTETGIIPRHFFMRRRYRPRPAKLATIIFSASLHTKHRESDYCDRGGRVAAAVDALESCGFSVSVYVELSGSTHGNNPKTITAFYPIKRAGAPLDLAALWYGLRPDTTRRTCHAWKCLTYGSEGHEYHFGIYYPHSIGEPAATKATGANPAQTIYIPHTAEGYAIDTALINGIKRITANAAPAAA